MLNKFVHFVSSLGENITVMTVAFLILLILLIGSAFAAERPYTNKHGVRVVDGDTLVVKGVRVRLWGIDAPEAKQTGRTEDGKDVPIGVDATKRLRWLIGEKPVSFTIVDKDKYERPVVRAYVGSLELNEQMVRDGYAHDWPQFSGGEYSFLHDWAKEMRLGIWQYEHEAPWLWRNP